MPPRRRPARPSKASSIASRVHKITSMKQWESMMQKYGSNKVVFVQFYQSQNWTCKQMRPYFTRCSTTFRKAIFAEVDVDELEDVATLANVKRIPTYQCYWQTELVNEYAGGAPEALTNFIKENLQEYSPDTNGPMAIAIKALAAATALAGGFLAFKHFSHSSSQEQNDPSAQLLDIKQRIMTAQDRLRGLEKANRGKQARAQRKLLDQLYSQRRALERLQGARSSATESNSSGNSKGRGDKGAVVNSKGEGRRTGQHSSKSSLSKVSDLDALARLRHRKARGDAMYSDEEEVLELNREVEYF